MERSIVGDFGVVGPGIIVANCAIGVPKFSGRFPPSPRFWSLGDWLGLYPSLTGKGFVLVLSDYHDLYS
jgi:hypothetical protein